MASLLLVGVGQPLLDVVVDCENDDLLNRFGLKPGNFTLAGEQQAGIFEEIMSGKFVTKICAGGSVQNTMRVAQHLIKTPNATKFFGGVGGDSFAGLLKDALERDGVVPCYCVHKDSKTGVCAVVVNCKERSLCTRLLAAKLSMKDHIQSHLQEIRGSKVVYSSAFVLTCVDGFETLLEIAQNGQHIMVLNLSASWIIETFQKELKQILPYVDIVICNELEAAMFKKCFCSEKTSLEEVAIYLSNMIPKLNRPDHSRLVIFTQGPGPTIYCLGNTACRETVPPVENIVDLNGAGDAFAGGFLAEFVKLHSFKTIETDPDALKRCIVAGNHASSLIIQKSGCSFT